MSTLRFAAHLAGMTTDIRDFARDRDAETVAADFFSDLIPADQSVWADEAILDLAQSAIEFAQDCESSAYEGHEEDMADPLHGTDYDPCAICQPSYEFDMAVANLHDVVRRDQDVAAAA